MIKSPKNPSTKNPIHLLKIAIQALSRESKKSLQVSSIIPFLLFCSIALGLCQAPNSGGSPSPSPSYRWTDPKEAANTGTPNPTTKDSALTEGQSAKTRLTSTLWGNRTSEPAPQSDWFNPPATPWNWEHPPQPVFGATPDRISGVVEGDKVKVEAVFLRLKPEDAKSATAINQVFLAGQKLFPTLLQAITQELGEGEKAMKGKTTEVRFTKNGLTYLISHTPRENLSLEVFTLNAEKLFNPSTVTIAGHELSTDQKVLILVDNTENTRTNPAIPKVIREPGLVDNTENTRTTPLPLPQETRRFQEGSIYLKVGSSIRDVARIKNQIREVKPQSIIWVNTAIGDFPKGYQQALQAYQHTQFRVSEDIEKKNHQVATQTCAELEKFFTKNGIKLYITTTQGLRPFFQVEDLAIKTGGAVIVQP